MYSYEQNYCSRADPRLDAPNQACPAAPRLEVLCDTSREGPRLDAPSHTTSRAEPRLNAMRYTGRVVPRKGTQRAQATAPRSVGGSARRPHNGGSRGTQESERIAASWHAKKATLGKTDIEQLELESILYELAETCTSLMFENTGRVGDVARALGGSMVKPPVDPFDIGRYFGDLKGFPQINELITIVSGGEPVISPSSRADLETALQYGNHRGANEHLPLIWKKIGEGVR